MNPMRGIAYKLLSVAVFMAMASFVKATAPVIPAGEAVFFRSAFALPVVIIWLTVRGEFPGALRTPNPIGHLWRGLVGSGGMAFGFLALGLLPLPEVIAIGFAAPILATVFAAMFLGETIRIYRMIAVGLGLIGVILIISPRLSEIDPESATKMETIGAFAALIAAIFAALAQVFVRKLVAKESTGAIVFYFSVTTTTLSLGTLPFGWAWPDPVTAAMLIATGLLGGAGQILLTMSYRHAETSLIAPFDYAQMLLALVIGYFVFNELPTGMMLIGAGLTTFGGLLIIWRERQLGIERRQARKVITPQG